MALRLSRLMQQISKNASSSLRRSTVCWSNKTSVRSTLTSSVTTDVPPPCFDDSVKVYPEKIRKIVNDISHLSLLEVSQLNELLKSTLNLCDVPVMAMGATLPIAGQSSDEPGAKVDEPSSFTVKLVKYADDSKIKLIKEVKSLVEGMNLVQAKKFVEGVPQVIQTDVNKDVASKLKTALEAVGGVVELESS